MATSSSVCIVGCVCYLELLLEILPKDSRILSLPTPKIRTLLRERHVKVTRHQKRLGRTVPLLRCRVASGGAPQDEIVCVCVAVVAGGVSVRPPDNPRVVQRPADAAALSPKPIVEVCKQLPCQ